MPSNGNGEVGGASDGIRARRRAAGLSQERLAHLADCSLHTVALFERGYRPARSNVLPRIIAVLNDERPAVTPGARKITPASEVADYESG